MFRQIPPTQPGARPGLDAGGNRIPGPGRRQRLAGRRFFAAYRKGLWAEALSRLWLRLKGYRIVAARYRSGQGEIDIVAVRGTVLAFVEVKARGSAREAAEAVAPRQQERLRRAALAFLARHPRYNRCALRFDAVLVVPWRFPKHVKGAWEGTSA